MLLPFALLSVTRMDVGISVSNTLMYSPVVLAQLLHQVARKQRPAIHHGHEHPLDAQLRVQLALHPVDGLDPAVEKYCGCVGMSTESAAASALTVRMFSDS